MTKDSDYKTRKAIAGMYRKQGLGAGGTITEFLPQGRMRIIQPVRVEERVVTEEEKNLKMEIMKLEHRLNRILGKEVLGYKVSPQEKRLAESLRERIKVLKGQLHPEKE